MSWVETSFEKHLIQRANEELGNDAATSMYASYVTARDKVLNEIGQIAGVEPNLSDHGPNHIANVQKNVFSLLSGDFASHQLSAHDLYILALAIVFHDVGNLFGRADHHKKVGEVFDWARGTDAWLRREKTLLIRAVQAHTGVSASGNRNTLGEIDTIDHLDGNQIKLRQIAAVLRFADELAEGPQRTTDFYRTQIGYSPDAQIFHKYAACTHVAADRAHERIRLTYELQLTDICPTTDVDRHGPLSDFLTFVFRRISKLDDERRYGRFYCPLLHVFKQTDVVMNFSEGAALLPFDVRFSLDDLVVPGEGLVSPDMLLKDKCKSPPDLATEILALTPTAGSTS